MEGQVIFGGFSRARTVTRSNNLIGPAVEEAMAAMTWDRMQRDNKAPQEEEARTRLRASLGLRGGFSSSREGATCGTSDSFKWNRVDGISETLQCINLFSHRLRSSALLVIIERPVEIP